MNLNTLISQLKSGFKPLNSVWIQVKNTYGDIFKKVKIE